MDRAEQQLRLIQAVYRVEHVRQSGEDLEELRDRCRALLNSTAPAVDGDARLHRLLDEIRLELEPETS